MPGHRVRGGARISTSEFGTIDINPNGCKTLLVRQRRWTVVSGIGERLGVVTETAQHVYRARLLGWVGVGTTLREAVKDAFRRGGETLADRARRKI